MIDDRVPKARRAWPHRPDADSPVVAGLVGLLAVTLWSFALLAVAVVVAVVVAVLV